MSNVERLASFIALCVLSLVVASYAVLAYGFLPLGALVHPAMRASFETNATAIYAHIFASALALVLGPLQFWPRLRTSKPVLHRLFGRVYLGVGVLVGGLAGLFLAFHAFGGVPARLGFLCLAVAWLYTGFRAYKAIRARELAAHRRWMVRNFALTFAAVTLRLWLPASIAASIPGELAYQVIAWLCWVPNLVVAELLFNQTPSRSIERTSPGKPDDAAHLKR
jgi:uncharacterized membrane protein